MEIQAITGDILHSKADLIVVASYEGESWDNDFLTNLNEMLLGKLFKAAEARGFKGKAGQKMLFPAPDAVDAEFVLVVGLGKLERGISETIREAAGSIVKTAKQLGLSTVAMELFGEDDEDYAPNQNAQAIAEAALLADYKFAQYKKLKNNTIIDRVTIVAENGNDARRAIKGIELAEKIVDGVIVARNLVNAPAQVMSPAKLVEVALDIAKKSNKCIRTKILTREQCEKKHMNAFLAVAEGSDREPKFIHMVYNPERAKKKIALVGKGITFDSGGLSLKPANAMETMKCDMAGAASVLGVFATLASLKPNIEVHGIIAATDNMPSSKAIKPGDIVRASNKKTIEILNTDAEGRLALADSLVYAAKLQPDAIIDLATLTGACMVALGEEIAAVTSNNAKLTILLLDSANSTGEKMWELPLEKNYKKLIESDIADLRNIGKSNYGGVLTAALFLQNFVPDDVAWAHIDIAGPAFAERPITSYIGKGGTGFGVRTLLKLIDEL
ncbi:MAG: leucyl aminopeptidase [bacterium]